MKTFIVYLAVSPSNTYYIGITSQGFETRKSQHFLKAFSNRLETPFYKAIRKYNQEIEWFTVATNLTREEACKLEIEYIEKYKKSHEVYNVTPGGDLPWNTGIKGSVVITAEITSKRLKSRKGYKHSPETISKIVAKTRGLKRTESQKKKWVEARGCKEVEAYLKDGTFVESFKNRSEFSRKHDLDHRKILSCLKGERKSHKGFCFKYKDENNQA
ncbi:MAG: GIY-YIG nuclease family protein [Bacteroidetes bacterium]|nr:GIY-YIG nuclease family protein [Bacteroidota bacterium]